MRRDRLGYVPALDGLRGIAILAVIGYHFFGLPGGYFGVDVFFVLSGFLITTLLLEEHAATGQVSLSRFYRRRARRLLPGLAVLLVAVAMTPAKNALPAVVAGAFYMSNLIRAVGHPETLSGTAGHLWSLAEEEQFYLLWPALLLVVARWRPRRLLTVLAGVLLALAVYRVGLLAAGVSRHRLYFAPDTHADPLVVGCLAAVARFHGFAPRVGRWSFAASVALVAAIAGLGIYSTASLAIGIPVVSLAAAALVLSALEEGGGRLLGVAPLVWVGTISYSLYLWHQIVRWGVGDRYLGFVATFVVAWLSYQFVEQPFRRSKKRSEQNASGKLGRAAAIDKVDGLVQVDAV